MTVYKFRKKILRHLGRFFPSIDINSIANGFIDKKYKAIAGKYKSSASYEPDNYDTKTTPIYICWWQGYDSAPIIVKKCIDSVKQHAGTHPVIVMTRDNWDKYVNLPEYILLKVQKGQISLTHFSDIIRMALLSQNGGMWLDATIFAYSDIPDAFFEMPFYTIRYPNSKSSISKGRWTGYCIASNKNNPLISYCLDVFLEYWKTETDLFEYLFIDYLINYAYNSISIIKKIIDSVPETNVTVQGLQEVFNNPLNLDELKTILGKSVFFKLKWKKKYDESIDGQETMYHYFMTQI